MAEKTLPTTPGKSSQFDPVTTSPHLRAADTLISVPCPTGTPPRHVYPRAVLLSLRHTHRHPLPCTDPICATAPDFLLPQPELRPTASDLTLPAPHAAFTFASFSLPAPLSRALGDQFLTVPSPVQAAALPPALLGLDLVVQAKSGTGKTLVFALAAVEAALTAPGATPAALILAPTRELASQIRTVVHGLCVHAVPRPRVVAVIGGVPERVDGARLAASPPGVVVGTPGRVLALVRKGVLGVEGIKLFVLDEADRLLNGALGDAVPIICGMLPSRKQTMAFSATFRVRLKRLLASVMRSPRFVHVGNGPSTETYAVDDNAHPNRKAILLGVKQLKVALTHGNVDMWREKTVALTTLLEKASFNFCMVFTNEKEHGAAIATHLRSKGMKSLFINASIRQKERIAVMEKVRSGGVEVLVATDLLARGVDIESCNLVVHLDVPCDSATYLHRVGRAGRFGKGGRSVIVHSGHDEAAYVESLEKALGFRMCEVPIDMSYRSELDECAGTVSNESPCTDRQAVEVYPMLDGPRVDEGDPVVDTGREGLARGSFDAQNGKRADHNMLDIVCSGDGPFLSIEDSTVDTLELLGDDRQSSADLQEFKTQALNELSGIQQGSEAHAVGNVCTVAKGRRRTVEGAASSVLEENIPGRMSWCDLRVSPPIQTRSNHLGDEEAGDWESYAAAAYEEGYKEAFDCAHRMALRLGARLGWGCG